MFWILYQIRLKGIVINKNTITSIAIGGFDGMHLAHQELFKKLDNNGGIIVIQTTYANISPFRYRELHTKYPIYFYPLENIKHLSGKEFVNLIKEEFPNLKKIVVGYDFHFGHRAAYNNENLMDFFGGDVEIVPEYKIDNVPVHSRIIRSYLRDGEISLANKFLGYNYQLSGLTIKGQGLGKKQFVPTININVRDFLIPEAGIYITKTQLNETIYCSVTFIGHRVTTDGQFAIETHLLDEDFKQDVPKSVRVEFIHKIRDNKKFDKFEDLKKQIVDDINYTLLWFEGEK
ncbi:bifunctional riboflavin kinase/FAD synthetase [Arcobacteraceae bacterium]|nr:bifunctional riboflavin kinase/FAD synthetase [Arcobacteraceae bacterium]